jgi:hypothetical protein
VRFRKKNILFPLAILSLISGIILFFYNIETIDGDMFFPSPLYIYPYIVIGFLLMILSIALFIIDLEVS